MGVVVVVVVGARFSRSAVAEDSVAVIEDCVVAVEGSAVVATEDSAGDGDIRKSCAVVVNITRFVAGARVAPRVACIDPVDVL